MSPAEQTTKGGVAFPAKLGQDRPMSENVRVISVTPDLDEDRLWTEFAEPSVRGIRPNVLSICRYGFTEMVNNIIDHSRASEATLKVVLDDAIVEMTVSDNGVGVFRRIMEGHDLESEHSAALELTKGKVTTDPDRHSGEGIFFTARMFDNFFLLSGSIRMQFKAGKPNWWIEDKKDVWEGTLVSMSINLDSERAASQVFERFASEAGNFDFDKTVLAVNLFGEESGPLVSRSQAKRILVRTEGFRIVVLDFQRVDEIGPAFADEVFRVFQRTHPEIRVIPMNANDQVNKMILRALTRNGETAGNG